VEKDAKAEYGFLSDLNTHLHTERERGRGTRGQEDPHIRN